MKFNFQFLLDTPKSYLKSILRKQSKEKNKMMLLFGELEKKGMVWVMKNFDI